MRKMIIPVLLATVVVSAEDSPLVALAKRTNRKASKTPVITNETVAKSKGRLSAAGGDGTASSTAQAAETTAAGSSVVTAPPKREVAPTAKPAASEPKLTVAAPTGSSYSASTVRNIDPQSTVRNIDPASTARTIDPTSAAKSIDPQTTARTIEPESTAKNIEPQSSSKPPQQ